MTQAQVWTLVSSGKPCFLGEYVGGRLDTIKWSDDDGKAKEAQIVKHTVLLQSDAITVSEFIPSEKRLKEDAPVSKFARMTPIVVEVDGITINRGSRDVRGNIHAYEGNGKNVPPAGKA